MKTDIFQSCGHCWVFQICWHIECSIFTASSFRIWNNSTGIPSPPVALIVVMLLFFSFFFPFIFISWRLITLQYCSGFCHTLTWISQDLHDLPIPIPPPTSLSTRSLWVFPVNQARALVSCIQPGLVICFTLDNILVSMLFSWNIPPSPSPTESKSLFYMCLFLFCI